MNNILTMTIIKSICDNLYDLYDLVLILAPVDIFRLTKLPSFHVLHHNVEKLFVVIYFVNLDDVGMLELEHDFALV
jgi:hypothetical protein